MFVFGSPFAPREPSRFELPEDSLPPDHRARLLWRVVETLDLSAFTSEARAVEGRQGRAVLSTRMLLTLWLYAISQGIGSAREIARLIHSDDAFRWIVGDVSGAHPTVGVSRPLRRCARQALQRRARKPLPRTIVGVRVTNVGSDMGSITPMLADIEARTAQLPTLLLADANHAKHACITLATRRGVEVLIAVPKREQNASPEGVVPEIAAWRERMKTEDARRVFRSRAGLCELVNAHLKSHHGTAHVLVRGLEKVTCVALLGALANNLLAHAASLLG